MGGSLLRLLKGSGALWVILLAACGGRSSMLDTDNVTFSANQPSGGGSSGRGTSTGGKSGSVGGGNAGSSTSGATGGAATGTAGVGTSGGNSSSGGSMGGAAQGGTSGGSSTGGAAQAGSSGGSTGGAAQAGSSGSSTGGAAQAGSSGSSMGGAAGGTALDPYARSVCNDYCKATSQIPCPGTSFPFLQCNSACINEVIHSPQCQKPAEVLLSCLTTVYQNSKTCAQAEDLSAAKCSALSAAYQDCVGANPDPIPPPVPPPASLCSSYGSSGNGNCAVGVMCDNGANYKVSCAQSSSAASSCTCFSSSADGASTGSSFSLNESVALACYDGLAVCGFPQFGIQ